MGVRGRVLPLVELDVGLFSSLLSSFLLFFSTHCLFRKLGC
jgi:hypothetical protein